MTTERRVLWFFRWLSLLTVFFAGVRTVLVTLQSTRPREWSLIDHGTDSIISLIKVWQGEGFLILNAALVWILATLAERPLREAAGTTR